MKQPTKQQVKKVAKKAAEKTVEATKSAGRAIAKDPTTFLYVAIGVVAVVVGYKLINKIGEVINGPEIDNSVNNTGGSSSGSTISDQQARNFAQQLLDAMNAKEPFYGTDEPAIGAVFSRLNNPQDFIRIYNVFGKKDYNGNNSPPEGWWAYLDSYEPRDLVYWLREEISTSDDIYNQVKSRIESTGLWVF